MSALKSILLIDEDSTSNMIFHKIAGVAHLSDTILTYTNARDALEFLRDNSYKPDQLPDVIFLDLRMPEMSGWEFMEAYQQLKPEIGRSIDIYIVSTSDNDEDYKRAGQYADIKGYLLKPISISQLKSIFKT